MTVLFIRFETVVNMKILTQNSVGVLRFHVFENEDDQLMYSSFFFQREVKYTECIENLFSCIIQLFLDMDISKHQQPAVAVAAMCSAAMASRQEFLFALHVIVIILGVQTYFDHPK